MLEEALGVDRERLASEARDAERRVTEGWRESAPE